MKTNPTPQPTMKTIKPSNPPRPKFSSRWPHEDLTTPAEVDVERRLAALRARVGEDARLEVHDIQHAAACNTHDGRRCNCSPVVVVIIDGTDWIRLLADGAAEPAPPPEPHPDWLESDEGHHQLAESLPIRVWLRTAVCCHASTIVGEGESARFLGGVIDENLTRTIRRIEGPTQIIP